MLGKLLPDQHVYIYGAGFAGLTFAYRLKQLKIPFTLYEKEKVGGKISTNLSSHGPMETAASTLYMNADTEKFIEEINLPFICGEKKLKRWIWKEDSIISPFNLKLLSCLLFNITKSFPEVSEASTVADIFHPLLGSKYIDELLSPALQGIHAAEASDLHFLSLFPFARGQKFSNYYSFVKKFKQSLQTEAAIKVKGSVSFSGGMQTLINHLHQEVKEHLQPLPAEFILKPNTVICTSSIDAAKLLKNHRPEIAHELSSIEYRPITSLSFFVKEDLPDLKKSFGMLIPQKYGSSILGIIHQSEVFPQNYSAHYYSVVCKGVMDENNIFNELEKKLTGFKRSQVLEFSISSWQAGLPLYDEKRFIATDNIDKLLQRKPGLILFGNYTKGISLRSMIGQTRTIPIVNSPSRHRVRFTPGND